MTATTQGAIWQMDVSAAQKFLMLAIDEGCGERFTYEAAITRGAGLTGFSPALVRGLIEQRGMLEKVEGDFFRLKLVG